MFNDYEILGLKPGAPFDKVKRAFKQKVREWHPDRFPADDADLQKKAHKRFNEILEAFKRIETVQSPGSDKQYAHEQSHPEFRNSGFNEDPSPADSQSESQEAPGFYSRSYPNGDRYEGQMSNDMMHGMGIYTFANGDKYTGQFRFNKPDGSGKMIFSNGDFYSGDFRQDRMHGKGTYQYANGDRFIGHFKDDLPHGEGAHILASGKVYAGIWENGYLLS